jgi:integrase/recombinase XerD
LAAECHDLWFLSCVGGVLDDTQEVIMGSGDGGQRPRRIVVNGPLAAFADGLRRELAGQGYALDTVGDHVHLLADLSDWLGSQDFTAEDLTTPRVEAFLRYRRQRGCRIGLSPRAIAPILRYLRGLQAAPPAVPPVPVTAQEMLLANYRNYLSGERGVSAGTATHYLRCARVFLESLAGQLDEALAELSAAQVSGYVLAWAKRKQGKTADLVTLPALRSLLRYLHVAGLIGAPLAQAVPAGRGYPRPALPRAASIDQIRAVLAACDRDSAAGRRDYAILLTMARLALRGGEVARLLLSDIDWRAAEVTIRGKGARTDVLPLPADVGEAMADYLLRARPTSTSRHLFVTMVAPFTGLATSSITAMVGRACAHAGVSRFGPHGMRHAVACELLASGASMEEIGQLLRHAQERTTAIYAKVDQARLAELAMPCPQGAAR